MASVSSSTPPPPAPTSETRNGDMQSFAPGFRPPPGFPPLPPPPGFAPLPPRGMLLGSKHSPPSRRHGGAHLENCHSLSKTRVYDTTLRCDKCGGGSDFGWLYRCCHDTETRLYESIRDGVTEHFDGIGEMFSHQLKQPVKGPAARSNKLSLLEEMGPKQIESLSAPQLAKLLKQREHANDQAISDRYGFLGLSNEDRPYLKSERQECRQTLCPACGKGMLGEELSFLDLDGILKGDIPPTAAVGFNFRKHGRPVGDAHVVRNIGLRKAAKKENEAFRTPKSDRNKAQECIELEYKEEGYTVMGSLGADGPLTPSNTLIATEDSRDDLLELYTDGSCLDFPQDGFKAQNVAPQKR